MTHATLTIKVEISVDMKDSVYQPNVVQLIEDQINVLCSKLEDSEYRDRQGSISYKILESKVY